jgi:hypothetical protein
MQGVGSVDAEIKELLRLAWPKQARGRCRTECLRRAGLRYCTRLGSATGERES